METKSYLRAPVKNWGRSFNCYGSNRDETHLLLDGGKLHVPQSDNDWFLQHCGQNLDDGVVNFITERRTPIFKMMTDLDIYQPPDDAMTPERFHEWATEIQSVINDFFGKVEGHRRFLRDKESGKVFDKLSMLVCMAPLKYNAEKNKKIWTKTGIHLVWPFLRVNSELALKIRLAWIQHFEKRFGRRHPENIWEDVFDSTVFLANGLRMVGSDKMNPCPSCKGRRPKSGICEIGLCDGVGKFPANRIYRVVDAIARDGSVDVNLLEEATSCGVREIMFTSIRSWDRSTTPHEEPEWFDPLFFPDEWERHKSIFNPTAAMRRKRREGLGMLPENIQGAKRLGINDRPRIDVKDSRVQILQKWIKNDKMMPPHRIPDVYRRTEITDMTEFPGDKPGFPYFILRTDSHFCLNRMGEHNANSIYFLVNEKGLFQKCFCNCETTEGRRKGKCMDFCSSPYILPRVVQEALYPEIKIKRDLVQEITESIQDPRKLTREQKDILLDLKVAELAREHARLRAMVEGDTQFEQRFKKKR